MAVRPLTGRDCGRERLHPGHVRAPRDAPYSPSFITDRENSYNHALVTEALDTLISKIEDGKIDPPSMRQLVMFYLFKSLSESWKDYYVADYEYYKDKPEFPYEGNIGFLKTKMAKQAANSSAKDMMKNR